MSRAVPQYISDRFNQLSPTPAQQYNYLLDIWGEDWKKVDAKSEALEKSLNINNSELIHSLLKKQNHLASQSSTTHSVHALSSSPFMTGMGIDHPLENGFAFLLPYGIPYLPGSSVKGVLRTAAEELALGYDKDIEGWDMFWVWLLFGFDDKSDYLNPAEGKDPDVIQDITNSKNEEFESWKQSVRDDNEHYQHLKKITQEHKCDSPQELISKIQSGKINSIQGALQCWDVYPNMQELALDILTPHQTHYYQKGKSPHDCASPIPNFFMVIPTDSDFTFHVGIKQHRLPDEMTALLSEKLDQLFEYAFNWLGFGAKTSLGYGVMQLDPAVEKAKQEEIERQKGEQTEQRHQLEIEAAETKRRAEYEALPEYEQMIMKLDLQLEGFLEQGPLPKNVYPQFITIMNNSADTAIEWQDEQSRKIFADYLEHTFERLGWYSGGLNPKQRKKQLAKRKQWLETIRNGR